MVGANRVGDLPLPFVVEPHDADFPTYTLAHMIAPSDAEKDMFKIEEYLDVTDEVLMNIG
jgi:hypothetical protein